MARKPKQPTTSIVAKTSTVRDQLAGLRQAEKALKAQINAIVTTCDLDPETMAARINAAIDNKHGRVIGLINLLSATAHWPADKGEAKSVPTNKLMIADKVDTLVLSMLREARGYHTFIAEDLTIMAGIEPNYEQYSELSQILLEDLGLDNVPKLTIDRETWLREETKAIDKATKDQAEMLEAIEKYKA